MPEDRWDPRDSLRLTELGARTEIRILSGRMAAFYEMDLDKCLSDDQLAEISKHLVLLGAVARKTSDHLARIVNSERT